MVSLSWLTSSTTRRPGAILLLSQQKNVTTALYYQQHPFNKIQLNINKSFITKYTSFNRNNNPTKIQKKLRENKNYVSNQKQNTTAFGNANQKRRQHSDILNTYIELLENEAVESQTPLIIRLAEILEVICITLAFGFQFIVILLFNESQKESSIQNNNNNSFNNKLQQINTKDNNITTTDSKMSSSSSNIAQKKAMSDSKMSSSMKMKKKTKKKKLEEEKEKEFVQVIKPKIETLNSYNLTKTYQIYQGIPIIVSIILGSIIRRYYKLKLSMRSGLLTSGSLTSIELKEIEKEISGTVDEVKRTASQVDKLRMKLNLVSRDIRPIIQTLENNQYKQGTVLLDVNNEMKKTKNDIRELEMVISKSQDVALKQFAVLAQSLKKLNKENKKMKIMIENEENTENNDLNNDLKTGTNNVETEESLI